MNIKNISVDNRSFPEALTELRPFVGLPKSVLRMEGKTIALISMLQLKGLNRTARRKLNERQENKLDLASGKALGMLPEILTESDIKLLRVWANPFARMTRYWRAMQPKWGGRINMMLGTI